MRPLRLGALAIATTLITIASLSCMSNTAEAGWGHFRRHHFYGHSHVRYSVGWPSYGWHGYSRYYSYRPVHYYAPRYYAPTYYVPTYYAPSYYYTAPYYGYGCFSYGAWGGYGGFYSASSATTLPSVTAIARNTAQPPLLALQRTKPAVPPLTVRKPFSLQLPSITTTPGVKSMEIAARDQRLADGKIELKINVPVDARVTINDRITSATGSERVFFARAAKPGDEYEFVVRAEVERDGKLETETKRIVLQGGQISSLAFDMNTTPARPAVDPFDLSDEATLLAKADKTVNTSLKLHVPENAKVYLAGLEMKQTGSVRVFATDQLLPGQELADYLVRVVVDGAETLEKRVTLVGGQSQEVTFDDSPAPRLAAR